MTEPMLDTILRLLGAHRFNFTSEEELQAGIALALAPLSPEREVILDGASRIDFMIGSVGLEVKIGGGISALTRQLARYATHPAVSALVVVTAKEQHRLQLPSVLNGKPLHVIALRGGIS